MSQLINYSGSISLTKPDSILTFATQTSYVPQNIVMNINIPGIELTKPASGTKTFYVQVPNGGNNMVGFLFTVDSSGNTVITDYTP